MTLSTFVNLHGGSLTGLVLDAFLLGILTILVLRYYSRFQHDRLVYKVVVGAIWIIQCVQLCTSTSMVYGYLITDRFKEDSAQRALYVRWQWALFIAMCVFVAFVVQVLYAHRLYNFCAGRRVELQWILTGTVALLAAGQLGFGMAFATSIGIVQRFEQLHVKKWVLMCNLWLACAVGCDLVIAISMCALLHRSRTGMTGTDHLINVLIVYAIQSGAFTSAMEITSIANWSLLGFNFGHVFLSYSIGSVYFLSLLVNLLMRRPKSATGGTTVGSRVDCRSGSVQLSPRARVSLSGIHVTTEQYVHGYKHESTSSLV